MASRGVIRTEACHDQGADKKIRYRSNGRTSAPRSESSDRRIIWGWFRLKHGTGSGEQARTQVLLMLNLQVRRALRSIGMRHEMAGIVTLGQPCMREWAEETSPEY